jgi:cell division septal protein FtsQ
MPVRIAIPLPGPFYWVPRRRYRRVARRAHPLAVAFAAVLLAGLVIVWLAAWGLTVGFTALVLGVSGDFPVRLAVNRINAFFRFERMR